MDIKELEKSIMNAIFVYSSTSIPTAGTVGAFFTDILTK